VTAGQCPVHEGFADARIPPVIVVPFEKKRMQDMLTRFHLSW